MDALAVLIPLLPFIAAALIGTGHLSGTLNGEASESTTAIIASWAISMSCLLALVLLGADLIGKNTGSFSVGQWLASDAFEIRVNFVTTGFNVVLAALFSLLLVITILFSINYMHREAGFHRFFFILSLFASAMLLLVLSGNAAGTFFGWEIAGLCSYLLIAYAYNRPAATINATRVFVTNRIGDAGFILGTGLSYVWTDSINWNQLNAASAQLNPGEATGISLCFAIAAFAKSAQLPFTPWLARAMEGPTPSSAVFYGAVMIHAGVYLVCLLEPVFEQAPFAMAVLAVIGGTTALYSFIVGLTQTDVKSSLAFATSGQLGLMFLECGLGFWQLAGWHLCAHAVVRGYLFLTAPSLMHNVQGNPVKAFAPAIAGLRWAYIASLERFWLDQITDWTLVRPIRRLAHDLSCFDDHVVDHIMGVPAPAIRTISSLAQLEEKMIGARLDNEFDEFAHGSGLAGKLTEWFAAIMHWFEDRFVLRGIGKDTVNYGRQLGHAANKFEQLILRPRYLVLFVFITLLAAFEALMDTHITLWSESAAFPLLSTLTLVPLAAMVAILRSRSTTVALRFGFAGTLLTVFLSLYLLAIFDSGNPGINLAEQVHFAWFSYSVGVDGANILFIPLTAVLTLLALVYTLITRHVTDRLFIACLLGYEGVLIGAFAALNLMQFWLWSMLELIPVVLLTIHAGTGRNKRQVVALLLQYWGSGLLMTLAGFMFLAFGLIDSDHPLTFDWLTLKENNAYLHDEVLIFILLFFGFSIRMPLFPFHGWLPLLAEQGTVASAAIFMVGLKLGIYAVIRFILPMVPGVAEQWTGFVLTLSLISIFYGALLALMQINIRRLLAFAVLSHTGMLVIGIFCFNEYGLEGSLLLSIAYGLATAGMLFSVGLIYERTRTAFIPRLGGLFDTNSAIALLFLISALSTMVMPGTPGYDAAHLLIEGIIEEDGWLIAIAILIGNVLAAAFLLRAFQQIFIANPKRAHQPYSSTHHPVKQERIIAVAICSLLIVTGFYTTPWLDYIDQEATDIGEHYPMHGRQQPGTMTEPADHNGTKDKLHE